MTFGLMPAPALGTDHGREKMVSVLLVNHPLAVRRALVSRLSLESYVSDVIEARDLWNAATLADTHQPDVIVLDAEMPHINLRAGVRELRRRSPRSTVVVLTLDAPPELREAGESNITFVGKHEGVLALIRAIKPTELATVQQERSHEAHS